MMNTKTGKPRKIQWTHFKLLQTSVYWAPPKLDGYGGYIWEYPIEVRSRWEERDGSIFDTSGTEIFSRAVAWVDKELQVGGYLWKGEIIDTANDYKPPIEEQGEKTESSLSLLYDEEILNQYATYAAKIINKKSIRSLRSEDIVYRKVYLK